MPTVAIVGRPNAGKSALFNRMLARRLAIVEETPGVTRDRVEAPCEWAGRRFTLIDTGGLVSRAGEPLAGEVRRQTERAIAGADLVVFLVDAAAGPTPEDEQIAQLLRESGRLVLVVANKVDLPQADLGVYEFHALGFGDPTPVSATHGLGIGDLLDAICARLPAPDAKAATAGAGGVVAEGLGDRERSVRIALLGRPNVGKSSLMNAVLGEERVIVTAEPGTTRDAVDTALTYAGRPAILIDTAGLRRQSRVSERVEFYSTRRSYEALARADVAVLVVEATAGITDQDQRIARHAYEAGRAVVVAVNKWDRLQGYTRADVERVAQHRLRFLGGVAVCPTAATQGEGIAALMRAVFEAAEARSTRIATGPLNKLIQSAVEATPPAADKAGRRLHVYYATQPQTDPPHVVVFVNEPALWTEEYRRYLERRLRAAFPLRGTPVRWSVRGRRAAPAARSVEPHE